MGKRGFEIPLQLFGAYGLCLWVAGDTFDGVGKIVITLAFT
jgi:hypothetical protein